MSMNDSVEYKCSKICMPIRIIIIKIMHTRTLYVYLVSSGSIDNGQIARSLSDCAADGTYYKIWSTKSIGCMMLCIQNSQPLCAFVCNYFVGCDYNDYSHSRLLRTIFVPLKTQYKQE